MISKYNPINLMNGNNEFSLNTESLENGICLCNIVCENSLTFNQKLVTSKL